MRSISESPCAEILFTTGRFQKSRRVRGIRSGDNDRSRIRVKTSSRRTALDLAINMWIARSSSIEKWCAPDVARGIPHDAASRKARYPYRATVMPLTASFVSGGEDESPSWRADGDLGRFKIGSRDQTIFDTGGDRSQSIGNVGDLRLLNLETRPPVFDRSSTVRCAGTA